MQSGNPKLNTVSVWPSVLFGYVKDAENKEVWHIDEPAAEVVRKIYALCLAGRGPSQIARQLENEDVLVSSAYYASTGKSHSTKVPVNSCEWNQSTIVRISDYSQ